MGWIKIVKPASPAKHLHSLAVRVEVDNITTDDCINHEAANTSVKSDKQYPVLLPKIKAEDLPFIEPSEVIKRDGKDGSRLWIVVDHVVLDVTTYLCKHPGGEQIIRGFGGQDCSWQWWSVHNRQIWNDVAAMLRVGRTEGIENRHMKPKAVVGMKGLGYQEDWS